MARRAAGYYRNVFLQGSGVGTVTMDVPFDVVDGDTCVYIVFGMFNSLIDFRPGGNLEDGSITPPGDWVVGEYTYNHPLLFSGENFHVYVREWRTGDPMSVAFDLDPGPNDWNLFGGTIVHGVSVGYSGNPAFVAESVSWTSASADPVLMGPASGGPLGLTLHLHSIGLISNPTQGMAVFAPGGAFGGAVLDTYLDTGTTAEQVFLTDNDSGGYSPDYDYTISIVDGDMHTDRILLARLPLAPSRVASEPPVEDAGAQFTLRSRRVALQELPHQVTSTHLGRPL